MCCIIPHRRKVDILIGIYGIMHKEYVFGDFNKTANSWYTNWYSEQAIKYPKAREFKTYAPEICGYWKMKKKMIWGSCLENSKLGSSKLRLKNQDILLLIAETQLLVQYFHKDWFSHPFTLDTWGVIFSLFRYFAHCGEICSWTKNSWRPFSRQCMLEGRVALHKRNVTLFNSYLDILNSLCVYELCNLIIVL